MKSIEEMNAMEVCAYLVAKSARNAISEEESHRLYNIHCAKLKKEIEANHVEEISDEFKRELYAPVNGADEKPKNQKDGENESADN